MSRGVKVLCVDGKYRNVVLAEKFTKFNNVKDLNSHNIQGVNTHILDKPSYCQHCRKPIVGIKTREELMELFAKHTCDYKYNHKFYLKLLSYGKRS